MCCTSIYVPIYPSTYFFLITIWGIYYYNPHFTDKITKAQNPTDSAAGGGRADICMQAAWPLSVFFTMLHWLHFLGLQTMRPWGNHWSSLKLFMGRWNKSNSTSKLALRGKKRSKCKAPNPLPSAEYYLTKLLCARRNQQPGAQTDLFLKILK